MTIVVNKMGNLHSYETNFFTITTISEKGVVYIPRRNIGNAINDRLNVHSMMY